MGCNNGCGSGFGGDNCCWLILILLFCCGGCGNGSNFGGNGNSCWWIILLLLCCGGCGNETAASNCGCGC